MQNNDLIKYLDLLEILELDEDTKQILKKNNIRTVSQLLLDTLNSKGITRKQQIEIYHKCRTKITCFPRIINSNNYSLNDLNFDLGFKTGNELLKKARNNWNQNNQYKTSIHVGSESLMDFFDGGLLLGEINEIFGQDLSIIRRIVHWIISNTMFYSSIKNLDLDNHLENVSIFNILYIQTTNNGFDPIFIKRCFQRLCGELEQSQNSQISSKLSYNIELFLSNISIVTVNDYNQLLNILYNLPNIKLNDLKNLKLIIIDSITSILGFHIFAENQDYSSIYHKEIRDKIFIIGRLLRYNSKILNLSSIIISLIKQSIKQNCILGYDGKQLLTEMKSPTSVHFEGFGTFALPPPTKFFCTEIDQSWLFVPHNRILIESVGLIHEDKAGDSLHNYEHVKPHSLKILRWTIFKSNRLALGKYTCTLQSKVGYIECDCQFI